MLVNSKELLLAAQRGHFAVPGANFIDMESIKFHVNTAEELGLPRIIELAESHLGDSINLEDAALRLRRNLQGECLHGSLPRRHGGGAGIRSR